MKVVRKIPDDFSSFMKPIDAREFNTSLPWKKPVLDQQARVKLGEVELWLGQQEVLDPTQKRKFTKGYLVLFYGKAETKKTLCVASLAKKYNLPVYRVNLSQVVSKYLDETARVLREVLERAESEGSILIFDEAEALFGKRTEVKDAHDRYANIETSYLLQQVEEFKGLLILNSNMRKNVDEAFHRRLRAIIEFQNPKKAN